MKIVHSIACIGDESSGPAYSVPSLMQAVADAGCSVELHTLHPLPRWDRNFPIHGYPRRALPHPMMFRSPEMFRGLKTALADAQVIHSHGIWLMPNIYPHTARRGTACKLVVSPRGMLSAWALRRARLKKGVSWLLGQRAALRKADMLVATAETELREIRALGLHQPVALIPNGIDIPSPTVAEASELKTLVFMSRIHPKKGVEELIRAWRAIQDEFVDWQLKIVGPVHPRAEDDASAGTTHIEYPQQMMRLADELGTKRLEFTGELRGDQKHGALASADLFVLPTFSENFGLVVAEALSCGTPAICTRGAPWPTLESEGAGWWIDVGQQPLNDALRQHLKVPRRSLAEMGQRGRAWMERDYSWRQVGEHTVAAYEWLVRGGPRPPFVRV